MISASLDGIDRRDGIRAEALGKVARIIPGETMVGGGSLLGGTLLTRLVVVGEGWKSGAKQEVLCKTLSYHKS